MERTSYQIRQMNRKVVEPNSSWNDKPTPAQVRAIAIQCARLGIAEPLEEHCSDRAEARSMLYRLRERRVRCVNGL